MWVWYPPQGASTVVQQAEFVLTTMEDTAKSPEDSAGPCDVEELEFSDTTYRS